MLIGSPNSQPKSPNQHSILQEFLGRAIKFYINRVTMNLLPVFVLLSIFTNYYPFCLNSSGEPEIKDNGLCLKQNKHKILIRYLELGYPFYMLAKNPIYSSARTSHFILVPVYVSASLNVIQIYFAYGLYSKHIRHLLDQKNACEKYLHYFNVPKSETKYANV